MMQASRKNEASVKSSRRLPNMIGTLEETHNIQRANSGAVVASLEEVNKNYGDVGLCAM